MSRIDVDRLLAEDAWLRRLARRLVADGVEADDAAQQAWVAALAAPSSTKGVRSLRPWLGGVLRNVRAANSRAGSRREARERRAARDEALAATDEVVVELSLRRAVTEALLELEEPSREVVFRRFYRDESLKAIAARQGTSLSTAHARLERGLAALRAKLDAAHGGERRSWALGLASLAAPKVGVGAIVTGGLAMSTAVKVAAAVVVAAGIGVWIARSEPEERSAVVVPSLAPSEDDVLPQSAIVESARDDSSHRAAETSTAPAIEPDAPAVMLRGRVIDPSGAGVEGVVVTHAADGDADRTERDTARVATARDGSFAIEAPPAAASALSGTTARTFARRFAIADSRYVLLGESAEGDRVRLVVAPLRRYAGVVLDEADVPVAGAHLGVYPRQSMFRALGFAHLGRPVAFEAVADSNGRFELAEAVGGDCARLRIAAAGFVEANVDLADTDDLAMVIRLARPTGELELTGIVLDPEGRPVSDAKVSAGDEIATSAADGRFALTWDPNWRTTAMSEAFEDGTVEFDHPQSQLVALRPGFLPARLELTPEHARAPIVLVLGEPLSIEGRVVGENGAPFGGVVLWIRDPTHFGVETTSLDEGGMALSKNVEDELSGGHLGARRTTSGDDGRFRIEGLFEREYDVRTFDPTTATLGPVSAIEAGAQDVLIVLPNESNRARVAGRLVAFSGEPLADVAVTPWRIVAGSYHDQPPPGRTIRTDEEGRFAFESLGVEGTELRLMGDKLFFHRIALALLDRDELGELELAVPRLCELQVSLRDASSAASLYVLDSSDVELTVNEPLGMTWLTGTFARFVDGRSSVLLVDERATTLVLRKDGAEVARFPIRLDPDRRTELEL